MSKRMCWKEDERLYQPHIHSRRIRDLHRIKELTDIPMTYLVDQALAEFIERRKQSITINEDNRAPKLP